MAETLSNGFKLVYMLVIGVTGLVAAVLLHPRRDPVVLSREQVEEILPTPPGVLAAPEMPAQHLEAFRGWVWLAALLLAAPGCGDATRPNIVLMIGDDHGFPDFGFTGSRYVQTPNLATLAANGNGFLRAYRTTSHCRPSLASLPSGPYPPE